MSKIIYVPLFGSNRLVHARIGERRFIHFIVTMSSISDNVQDHIRLEFQLEIHGNSGRLDNVLWRISIHVNGWRIGDLSQIGRISGRSSVSSRSSKSQLIVDDQMKRS